MSVDSGRFVDRVPMILARDDEPVVGYHCANANANLNANANANEK